MGQDWQKPEEFVMFRTGLAEEVLQLVQLVARPKQFKQKLGLPVEQGAQTKEPLS